MPIILEKWEVLIKTSLNPLNVFKLPTCEEWAKSIIEESALERSKTINLLIEGVVDRQKIMDKQQYVQINQAMLIRLLDKLHLYKQTKDLDDKLFCLYNTISKHLEEVLNFIEDFFTNYFDRNEKVPAPHLVISTSELCRQSQQLKERLEPDETIDNELTEILLHNFEGFCTNKNSGPTYNELLYQKDLIGELLSKDSLSSESSITEVLFYFNFNADDFVTYVINKLNTLTQTFDSNTQKIAALRYEQKKINQFRTKLNYFLSSSTPSLKEQVNSWIEEEIKYLQAEPNSSSILKREDATEDKIQTSLSVSKLALLVRLMVLDNVITNRVLAQVLRTVVRTVATSQSQKISFGSFQSKYHQPDKGTISAVKDLLFRWINILNQLS